MKTIRFLIKNNDSFGYANGYVGVPKEHPYFGKSYYTIEEIINNIHGGLTFSNRFKILRNHLDEIEWLDEQPTNFDNYWIFGFDTRHHGNNIENCNKEYVISEVNKLDEQLNFSNAKNNIKELLNRLADKKISIVDFVLEIDKPRVDLFCVALAFKQDIKHLGQGIYRKGDIIDKDPKGKLINSYTEIILNF